VDEDEVFDFLILTPAILTLAIVCEEEDDE
jgi:hypothetical protein